MSQVGGFGNYSPNQFLFLSGSSLKKEDNHLFEESAIEITKDSNEDTVDFSSINFTEKFDESLLFDNTEFLQNNPFEKIENEADALVSYFSSMLTNILSIFSKDDKEHFSIQSDTTTINESKYETDEETSLST